jgi:hypothetical protein
MKNMFDFVHDCEATPHYSDEELGKKSRLKFGYGIRLEFFS